MKNTVTRSLKNVVISFKLQNSEKYTQREYCLSPHTLITINTNIHTIYAKLACCEVSSKVFYNIYYVYALSVCCMQIFRIVI